MLRLAALIAAGTFGVHQGRYLFGYRDHASAALATQGHAYLGSFATLVAGVLVLVFAELVRRVARGGTATAPSFRRLWLGTTLALAAIYVVQELVEGALAAHHPEGLTGVAGHGGWVALPLAGAIGLAIGLLMRGATAATELAASPRRPWSSPAPLAPLHAAFAPAHARAFRRASHARLARGPPLCCA
jgi:hypothetical protein